MSSGGQSSVSPKSASSKSPILAALGISLAIAAGSVLGTLDSTTVADALSGKWLTAPLEEAQQRNTAAIATLEQSAGAISRDIDFISARAAAAIHRNEAETHDRFAHLDAEIQGLKDKLAAVQTVRLAPPRVADPLTGPSQEATGLRSSLNELAAAHHGAVTALTKRLDRLEVMVGLSTDVTSALADPAARQVARRNAVAMKAARKQGAPLEPGSADAQGVTRPEHGHLFNVKPISRQGAPLRLSRLPG